MVRPIFHSFSTAPAGSSTAENKPNTTQEFAHQLRALNNTEGDKLLAQGHCPLFGRHKIDG